MTMAEFDPDSATLGLAAVVVVRDEIADPGFLEFLTRPHRFAYKRGASFGFVTRDKGVRNRQSGPVANSC